MEVESAMTGDSGHNSSGVCVAVCVCVCVFV